MTSQDQVGDRRRQRHQALRRAHASSATSRLRIQRGDRIGVVGANGAGKTTLLRLLTGEIAPDEGVGDARQDADRGDDRPAAQTARRPKRRVRDVLADGGDWIEVRGVQEARPGLSQGLPVRSRPDRRQGRHACRAASARGCCWRASSPGASNLLVLDEPTNDLDLETLDLLQEVIADYDGTVLIVSHDRDFLDRTVTVTLGLDGIGQGRHRRRRL